MAKRKAPGDLRVTEFGGIITVEDADGKPLLKAEKAGEMTLGRITFVEEGPAGHGVVVKPDHPEQLKGLVLAALRSSGYKLP